MSSEKHASAHHDICNTIKAPHNQSGAVKEPAERQDKQKADWQQSKVECHGWACKPRNYPTNASPAPHLAGPEVDHPPPPLAPQRLPPACIASLPPPSPGLLPPPPPPLLLLQSRVVPLLPTSCPDQHACASPLLPQVLARQQETLHLPSQMHHHPAPVVSDRSRRRQRRPLLLPLPPSPLPHAPPPTCPQQSPVHQPPRRPRPGLHPGACSHEQLLGSCQALVGRCERAGLLRACSRSHSLVQESEPPCHPLGQLPVQQAAAAPGTGNHRCHCLT